MVLLRSALMATTAVLGPVGASGSPSPAITIASLVPTQLQRLLDAGATPAPDLRRILLGGGPMPRGLLERARAAGFPVCPSYGLTEACSTVTVAEPGDLETAGKALPGVGVAVAAEGEILVSGATVNALRRRCARATSAGSTSAGRLVVTGRKGDVIVTGGENVAPAEVEAALRRAPGRRRGRRLRAPAPDLGGGDHRARRRARRAPSRRRARCACTAWSGSRRSRCPRRSSWSTALPRTASGKVRRARAALASAPVTLPDDFRSREPQALERAGRGAGRRSSEAMRTRDDARLARG